MLSQPPPGAPVQGQAAAEGSDEGAAAAPPAEKAVPVPQVVVKTHPNFDIVSRLDFPLSSGLFDTLQQTTIICSECFSLTLTRQIREEVGRNCE